MIGGAYFGGSWFGGSPYVATSGWHVTMAGLNTRSPIARDTASTPHTRQMPLKSTRPPAATMRATSSRRLGLWSTLSGSTLPPTRTSLPWRTA